MFWPSGLGKGLLTEHDGRCDGPMAGKRAPEETRKGQRWLRRLLGAVATGVLLVAVVVTAFTFAAVQWTTRAPCSDPTRTPADVGLPYEPLLLRAADGVTLRGWYIPPRHGIVILHVANLRNPLDGALDEAAMLARHGYGALLYEAPPCAGVVNSLGGREVLDVRAALDYLAGRPEVERIGAIGFSVGAVTLLRAAARYPEIEAVVAEGGMADLAQGLAPVPDNGLGWWMRVVVLFSYRVATGLDPHTVRPVEEVGRISPRPLLLIYGDREPNYTSGAAEALYRAAGKPKFLWVIPGARHGAYRWVAGERYDRCLLAFFNVALRSDTSSSPFSSPSDWCTMDADLSPSKPAEPSP